MSSTSKVVALTIDDGPSAYTREILAILQAHDARATFFIIGTNVSGYESTLQHIVRNGSELGNHAMYDEPSTSLSLDILAEQILFVEEKLNSIHAAVSDTGDQPPKWFRPGSGFFSKGMRNMLKRLGYRLVLGSIYPHDPQIPFSKINASQILSMVAPGGIIICHDGRPWTAPMLRQVLPELRSQGYRVVTITELLSDN